MKNHLLLLFFISAITYGCGTKETTSTDKPDTPEVAEPQKFDPHTLPAVANIPENYWSCTGILSHNSKNSLSESEITKGLPYHLLAQSIQGLSFLSVNAGTGKTAVWMKDHGNLRSFAVCKQALTDMGITESGERTAIEIATGESLKDIWKGDDGRYSYILTDVINNPESGNVATVASHVYNAVIVDVRDSAFFNKEGYTLRYDATKKTTANAWYEFRDQCNNEALVLMPVNTGELRSYAIAHKLFVLNLNIKQGRPEEGQNERLFEEILSWLKPNAPVMGWEQGVGEDVFVGKVTKYGNPLLPYDWGYNTDFTSIKYKEKEGTSVKNDDPRKYNYDASKNYVSFYLSDGDNLQWMMNSFEREEFYLNPDISETKMSFGLPVFGLSMVAPSQLDNLIGQQNANSTLMENFGGGYYYVDEYGERTNRKERLKEIAANTATYMQGRNCNVLGLFATNCKGGAAKEAYQEYISANNKLEGIIVVQYAPYAGGEGEIFWFKNSDGYDIPVITVRYSIWRFDQNQSNQGTPAYIASKINNHKGPTFSAVCVHAWSRFSDLGEYSNDPIAEARGDGNIVGASAAKQCTRRLNESAQVVNIQELIWQVRMYYRPDETKKILGLS